MLSILPGPLSSCDRISTPLLLNLSIRPRSRKHPSSSNLKTFGVGNVRIQSRQNTSLNSAELREFCFLVLRPHNRSHMQICGLIQEAHSYNMLPRPPPMPPEGINGNRMPFLTDLWGAAGRLSTVLPRVLQYTHSKFLAASRASASRNIRNMISLFFRAC